MLDEILSRRRSPFDKIGLGYDSNLETKSSVDVNTNLLVKEDLQNVMKVCKNITPPSIIEDMNSRKVRHQEGPSPPSMKIFFLVTAMLAKTLDTNQFIVNPMQ